LLNVGVLDPVPEAGPYNVELTLLNVYTSFFKDALFVAFKVCEVKPFLEASGQVN
jgi:hypothetical protein